VPRWNWGKHLLFSGDTERPRGLAGFLVTVGRLVYLTVGKFRRNHGFERAASLTFASIISLIPLVVLFFGFAEILGGSSQVVNFVVDKVFAEAAPDFQDQTREWLEKISWDVFRAGPAGLVNLTAIIGLLGIALGIFVTAERVFNRIWNVHGRRSMVQKVTAFWVILTTSPFMIVASIWVGDFLIPIDAHVRLVLQQNWVFDALRRFLAPATISFFAFTLVFVFLPATHVRITSAALGGFTAAALWQVSKWGFGLYLARLGEVTSFYKSLASVPLFLVWVYITWIVILLGGELSYVHQNVDHLSRVRRYDGDSRRFSRVFLGLFTLWRIAKSFGDGERLPVTYEIADEVGAQAEDVDEVARFLAERGFLITAADDVGLFAPARHPSTISLREVVEQLRDGEFPADAEVLGLASPGEGGIVRMSNADTSAEGTDPVFRGIVTGLYDAGPEALAGRTLDSLCPSDANEDDRGAAEIER